MVDPRLPLNHNHKPNEICHKTITTHHKSKAINPVTYTNSSDQTTLTRIWLKKQNLTHCHSSQISAVVLKEDCYERNPPPNSNLSERNPPPNLNLANDHHCGGPLRAMAPWPLMQPELTHSQTRDLNPPTASHDHHNHPPAHGNLNPTHLKPSRRSMPCQSEAYKLILRERERSIHRERKSGESMGEREVKRKKKSELGGRERVCD